MEIAIKIDGQAVSVAVTVEVYEYLDQAKHKDENLAHVQQRQRFFLYALEGMNYTEIGWYCGCSKVAVHHIDKNLSAMTSSLNRLNPYKNVLKSVLPKYIPETDEK